MINVERRVWGGPVSLLMWNQIEDEIVILTDTLATRLDGQPMQYRTKCFPHPQLRLAVGGTGFGSLIHRWNRYFSESMLVRDITMLDNFAPEVLRELWTEQLSQPGLPPGDHTVTLYHFGVDEDSGGLVRYTYRSVRDFESEFDPGPSFAVKPQPESGLGGDELPSTLEEMIALACRLRAQEDARPMAERVHIGGELIVTTLHGLITSTAPVFRWPDHDDMWNRMNELAQETPVAEQPTELSDA
jgi:hypothetical protein